MDPLLMMRPPCGDWARMKRKACCVQRKGAVRLMATIELKSEREMSSMGTAGVPRPAFCGVSRSAGGQRGATRISVRVLTLKSRSRRPVRVDLGQLKSGWIRLSPPQENSPNSFCTTSNSASTSLGLLKSPTTALICLTSPSALC